MKISYVTRISTLSYLAIGVALVALLLWSMNKYRQAFDQSQAYSKVWEASAIDLKQLVEAYLSSGEASSLQAAENFIGETIDPLLATLPQDLSDSISPSLAALSDYLQNEVRAAGKLSGNQYALIENNERQMLLSLDYLNSTLKKTAWIPLPPIHI